MLRWMRMGRTYAPFAPCVESIRFVLVLQNMIIWRRGARSRTCSRLWYALNTGLRRKWRLRVHADVRRMMQTQYTGTVANPMLPWGGFSQTFYQGTYIPEFFIALLLILNRFSSLHHFRHHHHYHLHFFLQVVSPYWQSSKDMYSSSLLTALALVYPSVAQYSLKWNYDGTNLFDNFDFINQPDTSFTSGFAQYVDKDFANKSGLAQYVDGKARIGVDTNNTFALDSTGRNSVRLHSKQTFDNGLLVADLAHMPVAGKYAQTFP